MIVLTLLYVIYHLTEYWIMSSVENIDITNIVCMCGAQERHCVAYLATMIPAVLDNDDYMCLKRNADFSDVVSVSAEVFLYLTLENNWDQWLYKFISMQ